MEIGLSKTERKKHYEKLVCALAMKRHEEESELFGFIIYPRSEKMNLL